MAEGVASELSPEATELVEFLRDTRGLDLTAYKPASLLRRIDKRMQEVGASGHAEYRDHLEVDPDEYEPLLDTILINVTSFFRDTEAWDYLASEIVPKLVERKGAEGQIRVWTAGCASGEEAYTLAMLLAEAVGPESFRERVRIYGTDVDDDALATARAGMYSDKDLEAVPADLRERYFRSSGTRWAFRADLRRSVIFGRHDLLEDPPMSRLDLLVCRNTLMYLNRDAQGRVLERFHFALSRDGVLFVGRAEMLLTHADLFAPISTEHRIFEPVARTMRERLLTATAAVQADARSVDIDDVARLGAAAFDLVPSGHLVVDAAWQLALSNETAREWFGLNELDDGRSFQDLEVSYRPLELRSVVEEAWDRRRPIVRERVERHRPEDVQYLDVLVRPILVGAGPPLGALITFTDVTAEVGLRTEFERSKQELETAYEELQSTNEELETTNEELQSTVEELETTNEEMQSTNEELETMNEELQSTNAELQTVNLDFAVKTDELDETNLLLEGLLEAVGTGLLVVDADLRISRWMRGAEELWGLRPEEVRGRPLLDLDIGFPVAELEEPVRTCLAGGVPDELTVKATDRLGRRVRCRATCSPVRRDGRISSVVIVLSLVERVERG